MPRDIKICGLKTEAALEAAIAGGASHVGFIFFPKSPRNIDPADAGRLRELARGRAKAVAVTVDADDALLDRIVGEVAPDMLQLHGNETPERVAAIKARYGLPVIKALAVRQAADLGAAEAYRRIVDLFLFDAKPPADSDLPGGNGVSFDWSILRGIDPGIRYWLSGGVSAGNVGDAIRIANPPGLDISSGVETAPGVKDPALIEAFLQAAEHATSSREDGQPS